jgi:GTPase SAR1 family protein
MAPENLDTSALLDLRSSEPQSLLDEIDSLRLQGISEFVFLPQIVVCGDRSSGKSSVLEAISGVPFPRSDTLCTRIATEVILRPAPEAGATVSIVPSQDASDAERSKLVGFKQTLHGLDEFPELVERAKAVTGISTGAAFSRHILRVEVSGPKMPKLTLVDLPGLIHSDNKQQSLADVELISNLVRSYMKNPRSVVLAVVSAKNDYANQIILKRAREVDPNGQRTLGLITKPDTLPPGSASEADYINLATNDNIHFRLGWHILKNRDYDARQSSTEERDQSERVFFSEGVWRGLPRDMVGVETLRQRLSMILLEQIKRYLPSLMADIQSSIKDTREKLLKLGDSHDSPEKQRQFLLRLSESFQMLSRAAIDGNYDHEFFGNPFSDDEASKRLRSIVQNLNLDFAELMRQNGHHRITTPLTKDPPVLWPH